VTERGPRSGLIGLFVLLLLAVAGALWLPRWWEHRLYRQVEKIAGVGAPLLPGSIVQARRKIDPGMASDKMVAAIGRPSISVHTEGSSTHDIWTYYYADGTMKVNLTDGIVRQVALDYNPPQIRQSRRP
jgi:hypothetical protein